MSKIGQLHKAISEVCPIHGVSESGRIDFKEEATEQQKAAARSVFSSFVYIPEPEPLSVNDLLAILKDKSIVNDADIVKARKK